MSTMVLIIFSFTLGVKIMALRKFYILRRQYPEKKAHYDSLIRLTKIFVVPNVILIVGVFVFEFWGSYV